MIELSYVTEAGLGAGTIRWFTHSLHSHADVIWHGPRMHGGCEGTRYGSRSDYLPEPGVQFRGPHYARFTRDWRVLIPTTQVEEERFYEFLLAQEGKPYDTSGLFASFLFNRPDWRRDTMWWCSELTAAAKEHAGIHRVISGVDRIAPNDDLLMSGAVSNAKLIKVIP